MSKLQKALGIGALTLALATGCEQKKPEYVTGTVTKERGTVAQIVESSGALFGNESVKFSDPTYVLQIKTDRGLYTAAIAESLGCPLESLALVIEEGTKVKILTSSLERIDRIREDKIGWLYAYEVLLDNQE